MHSDVRAYFKHRKESDAGGYEESVQLLPIIDSKAKEKSMAGIYKKTLRSAEILADEFYDYRTCKVKPFHTIE